MNWKKGTNLLLILQWHLFCGDEHVEIEVIGAVLSFTDSFDGLVIVIDYNKEGKRDMAVYNLTNKYVILTKKGC